MKISWRLAALILVASVSAARADGGSRVRFYIGVQGSIQNPAGDFDGDSVLVAGGETIAVPAFEEGFAPGFQLGIRRQSEHTVDPGLELSFQTAAHDGEQGGLPLDGRLSTLNLDFRAYFNNGKIQPFITAGVFLPWLTVDNGAAVLVPARTDDATFFGVGYNLGGGFSIPLGEVAALNLGVAYRIMVFQRVDGINDDYEIEDDGLTSGYITPTVALNFFFN